MRPFFNPASVAVFGVGTDLRNLAKNIIWHCQEMGFKGRIFPVGRKPGRVHGREIITDPESLPRGIELAVILVPSGSVGRTLELCGRKGIRHAVVSTGGFREYDEKGNRAEEELLDAAHRFGIRFIGPNSIGVICTGSGLCTPFNPMHPKKFKKGPVSLVIQSGGVTTQIAYYFSEEHIGFSKILSVGNKLNLNEIDFLQYLIQDPDTEQIHLYLESIEQGREFMRLARSSQKPVVVFKSNVSRTASKIAFSHTAALSNDDRIVNCAFRQAGIIRAYDIHDMTVAAKALRLPPIRGDRLVAISFSGGFSVILGDTCEKYGFHCPPLPRSLLSEIEAFRRGGVIRMSNPMDFGDVHDLEGLSFTLKSCLALDHIDGLVLSFMYEPDMVKIFGPQIGSPAQMLQFIKALSERNGKPIALSFFTERGHLEAFKKLNTYPVFNSPEESVQGLRMLRDHWHTRET